jgi:hypothetical protein
MARFDTEFVVTAPQVLNESVPPDHRRRSPIRSQTAHRPESRLEPAVIVSRSLLSMADGW